MIASGEVIGGTAPHPRVAARGRQPRERLQVEADDGFGRVQRLTFVHQGTVAVDTTIYDRPW